MSVTLPPIERDSLSTMDMLVTKADDSPAHEQKKNSFCTGSDLFNILEVEPAGNPEREAARGVGQRGCGSAC